MKKKSMGIRISKIEKHLLNNKRESRKIWIAFFYILSVLCIAYSICCYTIFIHQFNFESTITFLIMLLGMGLGFGSCIFWFIGMGLSNQKVKL